MVAMLGLTHAWLPLFYFLFVYIYPYTGSVKGSWLSSWWPVSAKWRHCRGY
jgi:hypothetical protein